MTTTSPHPSEEGKNSFILSDFHPLEFDVPFWTTPGFESNYYYPGVICESSCDFIPCAILSLIHRKSNLSSLFGANQTALNSGNESLTYTAPKQPKKQSGKTRLVQKLYMIWWVTLT